MSWASIWWWHTLYARGIWPGREQQQKEKERKGERGKKYRTIKDSTSTYVAKGLENIDDNPKKRLSPEAITQA